MKLEKVGHYDKGYVGNYHRCMQHASKHNICCYGGAELLF